MLRVDPEPFESLTAPRKVEGRLFLPRSSERGLGAVEWVKKNFVGHPGVAGKLLFLRVDFFRGVFRGLLAPVFSPISPRKF
jgi:hypothetical protein